MGVVAIGFGRYCFVIVADDVVVPDNAYTEDGRKRVTAAMSQMTSIRNAGGFTKACGTRYHPADIYYTWKNQKATCVTNRGHL